MELNLDECPHDDFGRHNCVAGHLEDASVICDGKHTMQHTHHNFPPLVGGFMTMSVTSLSLSLSPSPSPSPSLSLSLSLSLLFNFSGHGASSSSFSGWGLFV